MPGSRGSWITPSARSSPGTTTSGASRAGCATSRSWWAGASARRGRRVRAIEELDLAGKRVFIRSDLNVPLAAGRITDATRIDASLPTIRYVLALGGLPIVASHLGRPKGGPAPELSLRPVADYLRQALDVPVELAPNCVGEAVENLIARQRPGQVVVLENLRFHPEAEKNDPVLAEMPARPAAASPAHAFG